MIQIPSRVVHLEFLINLPPPTETDLMRKRWVEMISEAMRTLELVQPHLNFEILKGFPLT